MIAFKSWGISLAKPNKFLLLSPPSVNLFDSLSFKIHNWFVGIRLKIVPKIIIRTGIGSQRPLHPQFQHIGDFSEAIQKMCTTIDVIQLKEPDDIFPAYEKAFNRKDGRNTLVVEFGDYYNEK